MTHTTHNETNEIGNNETTITPTDPQKIHRGKCPRIDSPFPLRPSLSFRHMLKVDTGGTR